MDFTISPSVSPNISYSSYLVLHLNNMYDHNRVPIPDQKPVPIEEHLLALFRSHDKNGDGCLDKQELKRAFIELGAIFPNWRAFRALRNADIDGDGYITDVEMNALVKYAAQFNYKIK